MDSSGPARCPRAPGHLVRVGVGVGVRHGDVSFYQIVCLSVCLGVRVGLGLGLGLLGFG